MGRVHLVIPDSHAHPDFNNDRFSWLGQFIVDLKPDVIVNLGDQADMASLCSYDKGTKGFEGRRYAKDIEANKDANAKLFEPLLQYNKKQKATKHKQYKPETVFCLGNHEHRINRAINEEAFLDGTISIDDLGNQDYWDIVADFLSPVEVDGVFYSHYFTSGVMNRSISGENPARACLNKKHVSCISGHSHLRDFAETVKGDGKRIMSIVAGVYQDYEADYAGPANDLWWSGVVVLRNVKDGCFEHEWISLETLKERYGG